MNHPLFVEIKCQYKQCEEWFKIERSVNRHCMDLLIDYAICPHCRKARNPILHLNITHCRKCNVPVPAYLHNIKLCSRHYQKSIKKLLKKKNLI